jgi:UDP-GlcNAc:undecaprenyl-phosphate GlcNAc-1-phosphate transferase
VLEKLNYPHLYILIIAWFFAYLLMPLIIRISRRVGAMDRPGGHKGHDQEVPFLGGVGIFIAFTMAVGWTIQLKQDATLEQFLLHPGYRGLLGVILGALVVLVLGILDDYRPINAVLKLGVLFLVTVLIYGFGIRMTIVHTDTAWLNAIFNVPLTVIWIAGVTSAMNSLDNMDGDGAATGSAAVAAAAIFYIAWGTSAQDAQPWLSYLAVALLGACLGFLRFNYRPARAFLGDNGSFLVGFLLASMLVLGRWSPNPIKAMIIPCIILTVPLYDITLSTILRIRGGIVRSIPEAITYCGQDHITHRLVALGLTQTQAVLSLYLLGAISGFVAILIFKIDDPRVFVPVLLIYFITLVWFGVVLERARVYSDEESPQPVSKQ